VLNVKARRQSELVTRALQGKRLSPSERKAAKKAKKARKKKKMRKAKRKAKGRIEREHAAKRSRTVTTQQCAPAVSGCFANDDLRESLGVERALVMFSWWAEATILRDKRWEIQPRRNKFRGRIAICHGSLVIGYATLVDCKVLTKEMWRDNMTLHGTNSWDEYAGKYAKKNRRGEVFIWITENPVPIRPPIKILKKQGAVAWAIVHPASAFA
jgi:hypothetical protein